MVSQMSFFDPPTPSSNSKPEEMETTRPLPHRVRPQKMDEFVGWDELQKNYPFLSKSPLPSLIFWGPPGSGKTTCAHLLAEYHHYHYLAFSAVMGNLAELRQLMEQADTRRKMQGKLSVLFIDEIHRFNKAQQDALLPHVEAGHFILIGATTENPKVAVNRALLSRVQQVELRPLTVPQLEEVLLEALRKVHGPSYPKGVWKLLAVRADGDARRALSFLDLLIQYFPSGIEITSRASGVSGEGEDEKSLSDEITHKLFQNKRDYDRQGDRHYDIISAFIKSLRGSDPDATLLWLAIMLDGGEDPLFIARRMMIFAAEDVGNADPWGLMLATSTFTAISHIGMPEGRILLSQAATYLASTVKSNASYVGINEALDFVEKNPTIPIPSHLKNPSSDYLYPHNYPGHYVKQSYAPFRLPSFYRPTTQGREKFLKEHLENLRK